MMQKRLISCVLICLLFLTALTLTATAGENTQTEERQTDYASFYVQEDLEYFFFFDGKQYRNFA